jgi:hypothetical protein
MKIELKKISFNERMSEETNCFVADLYINGKKVGYCKNSGHGGCTDYHGDSPEHNQIIREAENYFMGLPKVKSEEYNFEYQPTLESAIDEELEKYLKDREEKKMSKLFITAVVIGIPNGYNCRYYKFKRPLSEVPVLQLKVLVARILNKELKENEQILNTNFKVEDGEIIFIK